MDQETLYTSSKWDILKALESGSKSPVDLAKHANTSLANVSQQLRLLELAGIVKSERVPNRDKGQPRILYALTGNGSYMIVTSLGFVNKKAIILQSHQLELMKILFCEDQSLHYYMQKLYWNLEEKLSSSKILAFDHTDSMNIKVIVDDSVDKKGKEVKLAGPNGEKRFIFTAAKSLANLKEGKYTILRDL